MKKYNRQFLLSIVFLSIIFTSSCSANNRNTQTKENPSENASLTESKLSSFTNSEITVGFSDETPKTLSAAIALPGKWKLSERNDDSDIYFVISQPDQTSIAQWIYALVAPFSTVQDSVESSDLINFWTGKSVTGLSLENLLVSPVTYNSLVTLWGEPSSQVKITESDDILSEAWLQDNTWAIIPFEELEPKWKVITIDGSNPVEKNFSSDSYILTIPYTITCSNDFDLTQCADLTQQLVAANSEITNRHADKLTTVLLTGVTALVRGTALLMERNGMTYPAEPIMPILQDADILHVSNEIPFAEKCPFPFPRSKELVFCSRPQYMDLLDVIGTDVVELSGDHFKDWGPDAMYYTLQIYNDRNLPYYGGGKDLEDARKPLIIENNGNRIAFIGCNAKPLGYSSASATTPGAVHCNFEWMTQEITRLKQEGYVTIATFQHLEYYAYEAKPELKVDFHKVADAGADIVSGSQAHQPHAIEFYDNAYLHYGLGNLFFDQYYEGEAVQDAFMDRHVIYNGKYISTQLLTIKAVDLAQVRQMNSDERNQLLTIIFKASGWKK